MRFIDLNFVQSANRISHLSSDYHTDNDDQSLLYDLLKQQIIDEKILLTTHYYTPSILQDLTSDTGGIVADSLKMAQVAHESDAEKILVAGVKFMAESAKIMSPEKAVYSVDKNATCSLDEGCDPDAFARWKTQHPDRTVVVYTNTSAKIKMQADWVVTSSIALPIIEHISETQPILWAPDKHLGNYLQKQTDADMLIWDTTCIVHDEFKADELQKLMRVFPQAKVLVHPESPESVIQLADIVGSTSQILQAVQDMDSSHFIIATDAGLFHQIRKQAGPDKVLIEAPTAGQGSQCRSCARCPWMAMNTLSAVKNTLDNRQLSEVKLSDDICFSAQKPIARMLDFAAKFNR